MTAERWERRGAKVILIAADGSTLLFRGGDPARPDAGTWWFPPGGGVEPDETVEAAARREVLEETGLELDELGPVAARRLVEFQFDGRTIVSDEVYFVVRVAGGAIDTDGWTELEREVVEEHRWWTVDELRADRRDGLPRRPPRPRRAVRAPLLG